MILFNNKQIQLASSYLYINTKSEKFLYFLQSIAFK